MEPLHIKSKINGQLKNEMNTPLEFKILGFIVKQITYKYNLYKLSGEPK